MYTANVASKQHWHIDSENMADSRKGQAHLEGWPSGLRRLS